MPHRVEVNSPFFTILNHYNPVIQPLTIKFDHSSGAVETRAYYSGPRRIGMADSGDSDVDPTDESDSEWRYSIEDVGSEAADIVEEETPIEPESISLEHATFVALGVLLTLGVVVTGL